MINDGSVFVSARKVLVFSLMILTETVVYKSVRRLLYVLLFISALDGRFI